MIQIKNFTKEYVKGIKAVDNLNLMVNNGEIHGFLGHNGAGKTTTLKCIVGIIDDYEGEILINNLNIKNNEIKYKQEFAYIPDNPVLYEYLTGIEYLNFISDIYGLSKSKREENILKYTKYFSMENSLNEKIASYSHGMKQKIALISALIHEPKVLILDEPFVGLDPVSTHNLKELMGKMASNGATIFFSTHILDVAEKLCNKVTIIKNGKMVYSGNMDNLNNKSLEDLYLELDNAII